MPQDAVLIVEDSPTQALRLRLLLEERGYQVTVARDGKEALELLEKRSFPVVITDWVMPEMNGIEFCKAVRARPDRDYVYIILLTARGATEDMVDGLEAGADDYLVKPVDAAELVARLNTARRIIDLQASLQKKNEELARLTVVDPLTGAFNRRYLNERLPGTIRRALRYRTPLSIVMCDIDHFKRVNDAYDHLMGDEALKAFAEILLEAIRKQVDWVVRYGGEEFVIVLPDTGHEGAMEAAERYRKETARREIRRGDIRIHITASFGVATMEPGAEQRSIRMEELVSAADRCLLQAKDTGRNRTVGTIL